MRLSEVATEQEEQVENVIRTRGGSKSIEAILWKRWSPVARGNYPGLGNTADRNTPTGVDDIAEAVFRRLQKGEVQP